MSSTLPKAIGDVDEGADDDMVQALVGLATVDRAQMSQIRTQFDVVEIIETDQRREERAAAIPSRVQPLMVKADMVHQTVHFRRVGIAAHQRDAGDIAVASVDKRIEG